ncbi:hypothetical protein [Mycobacterium sp. E342]|uniref:hypothetical protein n=1 Tax=Mycobacterium sp. E342 TaxID=1834147 RepID=UPI0012E9E80E|nr:hypothetical protein [Mycobacterium sp. E342]
MIEKKPFGPAEIRVRRVNGEVAHFSADSSVNINEAWLLTITEPGRKARQLNEYEWIEVATPDGTVVQNDSRRRIPSRN